MNYSRINKSFILGLRKFCSRIEFVFLNEQKKKKCFILGLKKEKPLLTFNSRIEKIKTFVGLKNRFI